MPWTSVESRSVAHEQPVCTHACWAIRRYELAPLLVCAVYSSGYFIFVCPECVSQHISVVLKALPRRLATIITSSAEQAPRAAEVPASHWIYTISSKTQAESKKMLMPLAYERASLLAWTRDIVS